MAGFKKKLPMSAAMRQGGFGTVPPPKAGGGAPSLKAPMAGKAAKAPEAPTFGKSSGKMPGLPKMPKIR